jgi:hypothetical protein
MKKILSLFIGLFTLALFSSSFAQDMACESLFANYPKPSVELTSMESTITSTISMNGQEVNSNIAQTIDYTGRRMYQTIDAMGQKIVMRYADGAGTMEVGGMNMPVPAESLAALEGAFDQGLVQGLPENYTIISCDGSQAYAELLEGEQVTVESDIPGMGKTTSKIIFAEDGKTAGAISTVPGQGEMLIVFDTMDLDEANIPTNLAMSMYQFDGTNATPMGTTSITISSYNQPVDEALFAPAE